jgi:hypothetical protein
VIPPHGCVDQPERIRWHRIASPDDMLIRGARARTSTDIVRPLQAVNLAMSAEKQAPTLGQIICNVCHLGGERPRCWHCDGTGRLFWVNGYAYPYTPQGEQRAKKALARRS